jgi:capsular polysaccharide biosynthesis protein
MNNRSQYRYRNALDLAAVDADRLAGSVAASVFVEPPGKTRTFHRRAPIFHDDPDGVGLFPDFSDDTIIYPPPFVASARNARLVGYRTILTQDEFFFNDDSVRGPRRRQFLTDLGMPEPMNEETGLWHARAKDRFALETGERTTQHVEGTVILLSSEEPSNYGSWLFRILPKLHTVAQINLPAPPRYLVWAEIPAFREYLRLMNVAKHQVVHHDPKNVIYHLDHVMVPSNRNNQAFLDPQSVSLYAGLRDKVGGRRQPGARIYVSRMGSRNTSSRVMLNEADLIERLMALDFRIVVPETLPVAEQIQTFASAEMVVGPAGSGMFNVVFCHPGTKVIDIESEPHWIHAHRGLFASCGLNYGIFVGNATDHQFREHHQAWNVNIDALISRIASFSEASTH